MTLWSQENVTWLIMHPFQSQAVGSLVASNQMSWVLQGKPLAIWRSLIKLSHVSGTLRKGTEVLLWGEGSLASPPLGAGYVRAEKFWLTWKPACDSPSCPLIANVYESQSNISACLAQPTCTLLGPNKEVWWEVCECWGGLLHRRGNQNKGQGRLWHHLLL